MKHSAVPARVGLDVRGYQPTAERARLRVKRLIDLALAPTGLLLLAPLFVVLALLIRLESPGPVFFCQTRVGQGGRRFKIWKFRTMHAGVSDEAHRALISALIDREACQAQSPAGAIARREPARDARVTRFGRWLRRTSLDELPQLINVLRGEMSLVGPRPVTEYELELYEPWQRARLQMPQGMTGLWQVSGRNAVASLLERGPERFLQPLGVGYRRMLELDVTYVRRWSLGLDLRIMLRTLPIVARPRRHS